MLPHLSRSPATKTTLRYGLSKSIPSPPPRHAFKNLEDYKEPKEDWLSKRHLPPMFTAALFTIAKLRTTQILPFVTTWMIPEDIMLWNKSVAEDKHYMIPFIGGIEISQTHRSRELNGGCQGLRGGGNGELQTSRRKVSVKQNENAEIQRCALQPSIYPYQQNIVHFKIR